MKNFIGSSIYILIFFFVVLFHNTFAQTDGSLDTSFNIGTGFDDGVYGSIIIQPDGKIIIGGLFTMYNGAPRNRIIRLNSDGSMDNSFNPGTGFNDWLSDIVLQPDGRIIVVGNFTSYNGSPRNRIVRLNSDGTLDNTFITGTGFDDYPLTAELQQDGKVVIGGWFTSYNSSSINYLIRLNTDGSMDNSFYSGTGFDANIEAVAQQLDGKWIVTGFFDFFNSTPCPRIARLNTNGTIDSSFNPGTGPGASGFIGSIKLQSDGRIVLAGSFSNFNGVPDTSIVRINSNGSVDSSFDPGTGFGQFPFEVWTLALQPDGKIIAGGQFNSYNDSTCNGIARLNSDGSLDTSFNSGTGFNYHEVYSLALQADGKLIAGGVFTSYDSVPCNYITRLHGTTITVVEEVLSDSFSINVFPNPVTENVTIEISSALSREKFLSIHNILGEEMLSKYFSESKCFVEVSDLKNGIYFIRIQVGDIVTVKRVVKLQ